MRLADEYDAAQERGEVKCAGKPVIIPDGNNKAAVTDIGLTRQSIHEMRRIRDAEAADPGVLARTVDALLAAGQEPTRAAMRREIVARGENLLVGETDINRAGQFFRTGRIGDAGGCLADRKPRQSAARR